MTPSELLSEVTSSITQLTYDDASDLKILLKQSLRVYQECSGVTKQLSIQSDEATSFAKPELFRKVVSASDKNHRWCAVNEQDQNLSIQLRDDHEGPFKVTYLMDLERMDFDNDHFPSGVATSLLFDYLSALIEEKNNASLRRIYTSGGMDTSSLEMPSEIKARLAAAKEEMKSRRAVLPPASVS